MLPVTGAGLFFGERGWQFHNAARWLWSGFGIHASRSDDLFPVLNVCVFFTIRLFGGGCERFYRAVFPVVVF